MHTCGWLVVALLLLGSLPTGAVKATSTELGHARKWSAARFGSSRRSPTAAPPFSFIYGGRPSAELLPKWQIKGRSRRLDGLRTERVVTYTDPATGLVLTCRAIEYRNFPTVEWTLYFKNTGEQDTPILEDLWALDLQVQRGEQQSEFVLHHHVGSQTTPRDYAPLTTTLTPGQEESIGATGGRPLNTEMPYFNLEWGGQGLILALGWPGQWSAKFIRDAGEGLQVVAGQEKTHFKLHPGESVRTPLVVLQFWHGGDWVRAQNLWRRWMIAHNLPRPGGKLLDPVFSSGATADLFPNLVCGQEDEISLLEGHARRGLKIDYWWRDAGWYPCQGNWWQTGTWEPDPVRYPGGLRAVADAAHAHGMKFLVWFEPERVEPGTWLYENHPEWLLGRDGGSKLLNLGNPAAWNWVVQHIDKLITDHHIDMYRQDFNIDPLPYWQANDAEDRQGITEIKYIEGLLAYWDELKKRHPNMPFDCCASGGRRNELEMMRRGVPLSKSDYAGGTTSSQCQLYGIAFWLPYFGAGVGTSDDPYVLRSNIAPWIGACWNTLNDSLNYEQIRRFLAEWRRVVPYLQGDFYPLTSYSLEENVWMAWQFDVPEKGEGLVQAFRRGGCEEESQVFKLRGLSAKTLYAVEDLDTGTSERRTGRELMAQGWPVRIVTQPGASLFVYRAVNFASAPKSWDPRM